MTIGYDLLEWNRSLLLDLQFREGVGALTYDYAKPHHTMTFHGPPTWRQAANDLNYLDFEAGTPDFLDIAGASSTDLDFVAHTFTLATWINYESIGTRYIMCRGLEGTDGWEWYVANDSELVFTSSQAGAHQHTTSANGVATLATWVFVAMTRNGTTVVPYVNGVPSIGTQGTHVNPLTSARELHIGINDAEGAGFFDGALWRPRIWTGALSASLLLAIFNHERGLFGV